MSYTGFFAETDLYEVAKDGNAEKGSWVVPVARAEGIAAKDFVRATDPVTGEEQAGPARARQLRVPPRRPGAPAVGVVLHARGAHPVRRLAGARRAARPGRPHARPPRRSSSSRSASRRSGPARSRSRPCASSPRRTCKRRQDELGQTIDPDEYPRELQQVKAYLALHQTYGVDLNATAVELAEISLWLDTMVEGLAGAVVRPAPAARQLAHRRAPGGVHARAGDGQVVAEGGPGAHRRR